MIYCPMSWTRVDDNDTTMMMVESKIFEELIFLLTFIFKVRVKDRIRQSESYGGKINSYTPNSDDGTTSKCHHAIFDIK